MHIIMKQINIEMSKKKYLFLLLRNLLKYLVKMIIKTYKIHTMMFMKMTSNNVSFFNVNYFNEHVFYLMFYYVKVKRGFL